MAGLCKLSLFFESNHRFILWDSLQQVCSELLSCIPDSNHAQTLYFDEDILIWDMACHCLGIMCRESAAVLEHARLHHAVPKILNLLNTQEATLRNTACRALIVLTDSIEDLKHFLINHDVTRDVLLQQMSSFDDELKSIFCCVCARCFGFTTQHFCSCCHDLACKIGVWMFTKYQSESVHGRLDACCFGMHIEDAISSACRTRCLHFTVQFTRWM